MIFNFAICDYEGCQNWYFDVDDNVTRDEIIEKFMKASEIMLRSSQMKIIKDL